MSAVFAAKSDEVAILFLTVDGKHLRFIAPRKFASLGTIPVTKRDSIAVDVFEKKTGEAMNNVPMVKHVAFFESVKLRDRVVPIQKMITVPILFDGRGRGRRADQPQGRTPTEAGPDFTAADVRKAQEIFEAGGAVPRRGAARQVLSRATRPPRRTKPVSSPCERTQPGLGGRGHDLEAVRLHGQLEPVARVLDDVARGHVEARGSDLPEVAVAAVALLVRLLEVASC